MKKATNLFIISILIIFAPVAYSAVIIDTGEPLYTEHPRGSILTRYNTSEGIEFNWFAGKITLNDQYNIDSIKTFFDYNRPEHYPIPDPGSLVDITLKIYGNIEIGSTPEIPVLEVPDLTQIFFVQNFGIPSNWQYGWYGIENANLLLLPGVYWVAFEVHDPTLIETRLTTPQNNLEKIAQTNEQALNDVGYFPSSMGNSFALRIEGNVVSAVPEPACLSLFAFGAFYLKSKII